MLQWAWTYHLWAGSLLVFPVCAQRFELARPTRAPLVELNNESAKHAIAVAASLYNSRLVVLIYVVYKDHSIYDRYCQVHGQRMAGGAWFLPTATLPMAAHELSCDYGSDWPATAVTDETCEGCFYDFDRHFDPAEEKRWKVGYVFNCPTPPGWSGGSEQIVRLVSQREGALDLEMQLRRVDAAVRAVTACSEARFRFDLIEHFRPGITAFWLRWHLDVIGIDHIDLYDNDGSMLPILQNIEDKEPDLDLASRVTYRKSWPSSLGPDVAELLQPQSSSIHRVYARFEGECSRPILLVQLQNQHCLIANRGRSRWVLNLHNQDLFLVPPRDSDKIVRRYGHRLVEDLLQHFQSPVGAVLLPTFESAPPFIQPHSLQKDFSWVTPRQVLFNLRIVKQNAGKAYPSIVKFCTRLKSNESWNVDEVLHFHHARTESVNHRHALCDAEETARFSTHACWLRGERNHREVTDHASININATQWHFRHLTFLMPGDCHEKVFRERVVGRVLSRTLTYDPIVWRWPVLTNMSRSKSARNDG